MSKKKKPIYGVGINDAGYPVTTESVTGGRRKQVWKCPFYDAWAGMLERCYSRKLHNKRQSYRGCSVAREWLSFSAFRAWMVTQDHEGKHLDKDILVPGNKVYSQDSCVFVSIQLNTFVIDRAADRGEWPIGVCRDNAGGKFKAYCCNPFTRKQEYLGRFTCPGAAHESWRARKHQHACRYADMQSDPRIAASLRSRYARNGCLA